MLKVYTTRIALRYEGQLVGVMESVTFEVYDTGIGISLQNQESLFKLFGKVMQKNKSVNKEGIGLGLYITQNLAIQLGGMIGIDSQEGVYTRFFVTLPVWCHKQEALDRGVLKLDRAFAMSNPDIINKLLNNDESILENIKLELILKPPSAEPIKFLDPPTEGIETERALCMFTNESQFYESIVMQESFESIEVNFDDIKEERDQRVRVL